MSKLKLTITCLSGLEQLLFQEVKALGGEAIEMGRRMITCSADKKTLYRLNINCRLALRILIQIDLRKAHSENDIYNVIRDINWPSFFKVEKSFSVRAVFGSHHFKNTHFIALKAKDGIVDRFKADVGQRPSVDIKHPEASIHLYYHKDELTTYLDSSAYSLHKRGYKMKLGRASINETLAAAIFKWTDWTSGRPIINPMCGVGTIGIEAAFAMLNTSPQLNRDYFGFQHWIDYDPNLYNGLLESINNDHDEIVMCSDIDKRSVKDCRLNVEAAEMSQSVHCDVEDFFEMDPVENSIILLNPPYNIRLKEREIIMFYKRIGDTLKFNWKNSQCAVISANSKAFKFIGLRPNKRHKVFNGQMEAEVRIFNIY